MKHHLFKILLVVPLLLFAQNRLTAQRTLNWTPQNSSKVFSDPSNWQVATTNVIPAVFNTDDILSFGTNALTSGDILILNSNVTVGKINFTRPTSGFKIYINLNGKDLTCSSYKTSNTNTLYLIPNSNSSLIFHNLSENTSNVDFARATKVNIPSRSYITLKSIQKTGTDPYNANIRVRVGVSEKISCHSGTLTVFAVLLLSDPTKTAYIEKSAGTIIATTTSTQTTLSKFRVQLYIPGGRRVFRFLAHPFNSAIALSRLTNRIDITGSGGTTNGFTGTFNNNPSAFYFDPSAADDSYSGTNPGWKAFANTTSNSWPKATPALIYIRGAKGEGIDGLAYTPSAVTLDMSGATINMGDQSITLTKGANSEFITVGNPYPSPIQMKSIESSQRSNMGSTYWIFDSQNGDNGGYISKQWLTDTYTLPAYAGFATKLTANGRIDFVEAHKTTPSATSIFMDGSDLSDLTLNVFVNDHLFDLTRLIAHEQAQSDEDYFDGGKMENADINFFTLSKNGEKLSIDARPFDLNTERIAMGLFSSKDRTIKIQADPSAFLNEHSVTLIDHYTNKQYNLNEGESAELRIDLNQSKSYGTERLELVIGQLQSHTKKLNQAQVHVYPNPSESRNSVNVQANSPIQHIAVMDISGRLVWEISPENKSEFMEIPETALANAGIYFIEITTPIGSISQKHIVQF